MVVFAGEPEIVVSCVHPSLPAQGPHPIYVFDRFGNIRDGWPVLVPENVGTLFNVTLVDLDGDDRCEIVGTGQNVFYALDDDGTLMATPFPYGGAGLPPSITDFEGDGIPEVLVPGFGIAVFRFGAPPYGHVGQIGTSAYVGFDGVVSADLDGDGVCEIVARSGNPSAIHVWDQNLQILPGWPQPVMQMTNSSRRMVDLADLDLDGDLEIVQAAKVHLNAFDVPRTAGNSPGATLEPLRIEWPTYFGNTQRTANYHHNNPPRARFLRGDANGDGAVQFGDAFTSLGYCFGGEPHECPARIDWNGDDAVDICDVILQLNYNFLGGAPAEAPWPQCAMVPVERQCSRACGRVVRRW